MKERSVEELAGLMNEGFQGAYAVMHGEICVRDFDPKKAEYHYRGLFRIDNTHANKFVIKIPGNREGGNIFEANSIYAGNGKYRFELGEAEAFHSDTGLTKPNSIKCTRKITNGSEVYLKNLEEIIF